MYTLSTLLRHSLPAKGRRCVCATPTPLSTTASKRSLRLYQEDSPLYAVSTANTTSLLSLSYDLQSVYIHKYPPREKCVSFLYAINDVIFIAQCRIPVNTKGQGVQLVSFERNRGPDSCNLTRIIDRSVILIEFLLQEKKKGELFYL